MAKRAGAAETPYSPVDSALARSVILGGGGRLLPEVMPSPLQETSIGKNLGHSSVSTNRARSLSREKRVLLTPEEERQIERLVDHVGEQLGTSLKLSHLLRACVAVVCHAEQELLKRAAEAGPLARPANGDAVALADFEQTIARIISRALRDAPAFR